MVSLEVRNSTPTSVAYETTSSAPLARQTSAGFLNPEYDTIAARHDNEDPAAYYKEKRSLFRRKKANKEYKASWGDVIQSDSTDEDHDFDTGEIDAIRDITDKVNSGELYATSEIVEELGARALALVPLIDIKLPVAPVENTLLRVVAVNPDFRDEAEAAIKEIYSNRPGVSPRLQKVIQETVRRTAQVATNPDDFINLDNVDEPVPQVDRIIEEASNLATARYINQSVQEKEWAAEDAQEKVAS